MGILEDIVTRLERIEAAVTGAKPPPPVVVEPPPSETGTGGGGSHFGTIEGAGVLNFIHCPATIQLNNITPGFKLQLRRMPGETRGKVKVTRYGEPLGSDGWGPDFPLPLGSYSIDLNAELPGVVLSVSVT
jgi:hypothetical protein